LDNIRIHEYQIHSINQYQHESKQAISINHISSNLPPPQAYYIFDELFIAGELQESSKKQVLRLISEEDAMMEEKPKEKKPSMFLR
jgi:hypothetical protein